MFSDVDPTHIRLLESTLRKQIEDDTRLRRPSCALHVGLPLVKYPQALSRVFPALRTGGRLYGTWKPSTVVAALFDKRPNFRKIPVPDDAESVEGSAAAETVECSLACPVPTIQTDVCQSPSMASDEKTVVRPMTPQASTSSTSVRRAAPVASPVPSSSSFRLGNGPDFRETPIVLAAKTRSAGKTAGWDVECHIGVIRLSVEASEELQKFNFRIDPRYVPRNRHSPYVQVIRTRCKVSL